VRICSRGEEKITFALLKLYEAEGQEFDWFEPLYWGDQKLEVDEDWFYY
jgi:hypothetical protein